MKGIKTVVRIVCGVLVFALLYLFIFNYLYETDELTAAITHGFYKQDKGLVDVVCIGPSTIYCGFNGPLAFHEYGFATYDYCGGGQPLEAAKFAIEEVQKTQSPLLYVIDLREAANLVPGPDYVRRMTTQIPWSQTRVFAAQGMSQPMAGGRKGALLDYLLPYPFFHDNWTKVLTDRETDLQSLFTLKRSYEGTRTTIAHKGHSNVWMNLQKGSKRFYFDETVYEGVTRKLPEACELVLRDLCEYCLKLDAQVLFVGLPSSSSSKWYMQMNEAARIVESYGFPYLDALYHKKDIGITLSDVYDMAHVNCYGADKLTRYMADYLVSHYALPDHRGNPAYNSWEQDYREILSERLHYSISLDRLLETLKAQKMDADIAFSGAQRFTDAEKAALALVGATVPREEADWSIAIRGGVVDKSAKVDKAVVNSAAADEDSPCAHFRIYDPGTGQRLRNGAFHFNRMWEQLDDNPMPDYQPAAGVIAQAVGKEWTEASVLETGAIRTNFALDEFDYTLQEDGIRTDAFFSIINTQCAGQTLYAEFRSLFNDRGYKVVRLGPSNDTDLAEKYGVDKFAAGCASALIPYSELPDGTYRVRLFMEKNDVMFYSWLSYKVKVENPSDGGSVDGAGDEVRNEAGAEAGDEVGEEADDETGETISE